MPTHGPGPWTGCPASVGEVSTPPPTPSRKGRGRILRSRPLSRLEDVEWLAARWRLVGGVYGCEILGR
jgi:hypothetical protein